MSMTIELTREEEQRLREVAARRGRSAEAMLADVARLQIAKEPVVSREDQLQLLLSEGLPLEFWDEYNALTAKLRAEEITDNEYARLLDRIQTMERWNVKRLEVAAELATLRGVSLEEVFKQQGLWKEAID